jgi:hypothetical protein
MDATIYIAFVEGGKKNEKFNKFVFLKMDLI